MHTRDTYAKDLRTGEQVLVLGTVLRVCGVQNVGSMNVRIDFGRKHGAITVGPYMNLPRVIAGTDVPAAVTEHGWLVVTPPKTRASDGRWRGESDGARRERVTARMSAWDR